MCVASFSFTGYFFFNLITFTIKKKVDYKEVSDESEGFCKDEKPSKWLHLTYNSGRMVTYVFELDKSNSKNSLEDFFYTFLSEILKDYDNTLIHRPTGHKLYVLCINSKTW